MITGPLSPRIKRAGREADHSPPSSSEVIMNGAVLLLPQYVFMAWTGATLLIHWIED
jgi:hypothetical protein